MNFSSGITLDSALQLALSMVWAVAIFGGVCSLAGFMTWCERKLASMIQDRIGPNRANVRIGRWNITALGLFHIMADPVKMFFKEDFIPAGANKVMHTLGPIISLFIPFIVFCVVPFAGPLAIHWKDLPVSDLSLVIRIIPESWSFPADNLWLIPRLGLYPAGYLLHAADLSPLLVLFRGDVLHLSDYTIKFIVSDLDVGMLFIFAIASLAVYGMILAGFSSNNKFSFLGAVRGANQMISYEVALGLTAVGLFMIYGGVSVSTLVEKQGELVWGVIPKWGVLTQPLAFFLFLTCGMAEIKRIPFDLPEGESEIVAGYFLEYS